MTLEDFEQAINDAINLVPEHIRSQLKNVAFVVDDTRLSGLLGLYNGIPLPKRGQGYSGVLPDKITIFQRSIEAVSHGDDARTRQLVTEVVHHEIGHYFGFSEQKVRQWEKNRRQRQAHLQK